MAVFCPLALPFVAYKRPGYFTNQTYLGGLLLLEFMAVAVWMYRRTFFPLVDYGVPTRRVDLPVGAVWTAARWVIPWRRSVGWMPAYVKGAPLSLWAVSHIGNVCGLAALVSAPFPNIHALRS